MEDDESRGIECNYSNFLVSEISGRHVDWYQRHQVNEVCAQDLDA